MIKNNKQAEKQERQRAVALKKAEKQAGRGKKGKKVRVIASLFPCLYRFVVFLTPSRVAAAGQEGEEVKRRCPW